MCTPQDCSDNGCKLDYLVKGSYYSPVLVNSSIFPPLNSDKYLYNGDPRQTPCWLPLRFFDKIDQKQSYDGSVNVDNIIYRNPIDPTGVYGYSCGRSQDDIRRARLHKIFNSANSQVNMYKLQLDMYQPNLHSYGINQQTLNSNVNRF